MKRFRAFSDELKTKFGARVYRVPVDAGFSCPNREMASPYSGCIYCADNGSGSRGINRRLSIREQIAQGKEVIARKYRAGKYLVYFQAFTNTYAPLRQLRKLYDEALDNDDVVGLIVGTRPDCLSSDVLSLLEEYHKRTYFWLEVGVQSVHDKTLEQINRGHTVQCSREAIMLAKTHGLNVSAHMILGLPHESEDEMLAGAGFLNDLQVDGVKIHLLHVLKDTRLEQVYHEGQLRLLEMGQYVRLVCDFLELLSPEIIVQRLTGDGGFELVAPLWSIKKFEVLNAIDHELERRGSCQGSRYQALKL
jgi:hypothetical protein